MHGVVGAVGQAEVVEDIVDFPARNLAADGCFDLVGQTRSFLDTGAGFGAHVKDEFAGVGAGKEVLPEKRQQ